MKKYIIENCTTIDTICPYCGKDSEIRMGLKTTDGENCILLALLDVDIAVNCNCGKQYVYNWK